MRTPRTTKKPTRPKPGRAGSPRKARRETPAPPPAVEPKQAEALPAAPLTDRDATVVTSPEVVFAARVPIPEPVRALPAVRRGIFFDVENTSRTGDIASVLDHLHIDWTTRATEVLAVGNWRVIGHETARLLARRGAQLVHSAPSFGVRDWSDLRIAVAAGAWLASARPGDTIEIVSDDQAFDAVGDAAASLGITFQRLSFRALAGLAREVATDGARGEVPVRRRRRRRGRGDGSSVRRVEAEPTPSAPARHAPAIFAEPHTAPADEIRTAVEDLLATSPGGVTLDALSNTLKGRGFRRPPGSPRLITRLRRLKGLEVTRAGIVRLVEAAKTEPSPEGASPFELPGADQPTGSGEEAAAAAKPSGVPEAGPRRRRRRGGRRRRGAGGSTLAAPGAAGGHEPIRGTP